MSSLLVLVTQREQRQLELEDLTFRLGEPVIVHRKVHHIEGIVVYSGPAYWSPARLPDKCWISLKERDAFYERYLADYDLRKITGLLVRVDRPSIRNPGTLLMPRYLNAIRSNTTHVLSREERRARFVAPKIERVRNGTLLRSVAFCGGRVPPCPTMDDDGQDDE